MLAKKQSKTKDNFKDLFKNSKSGKYFSTDKNTEYQKSQVACSWLQPGSAGVWSFPQT